MSIARKTTLSRDASGQYTRQIGWKQGKSGQAKFRLGTDQAKAELAAHKLALLWNIVAADHDHRQNLDFNSADKARPTWNDMTLAIAEAIARHQPIITLPRPVYPTGPADDATYTLWMDHHRQLYNHLIAIVPAEPQAVEAGKQFYRGVAEHRIRQAQAAARIAEAPVPTSITGQTLYQALGAYAKHATSASKREFGRVESGTAKRLKNSTPDMDLSEFGFSAIEKIKLYWAGRPESKSRGGKGTGRPISLDTVDGHLSTARRFIRWLDKADAFKWELPRHGMDALKINLQRLATPAEIAGKRHGVGTLTIDQLATLFKHANEFERLLLLLGLNAAMSHAEATTFRWDEIEGDPATIKRIRHKTGVYGEFQLWPETLEALNQWRKHRPGKRDLVLVTSKGTPYDRQGIANAWARLKVRLEKGGEDVTWWLPFKHLRKTAAQLVRDVSDGEVAGVFLSHGQPVKTDDLADVYSNRPFHKVAEALGKVRAGFLWH